MQSSMKTVPNRLAKALGLALALTLVHGAQAQQRVDYSKVEIKTNALGNGLYTLDGQGGTITALTGPEGVLLVDSQFAPLTDKLVASIKQVSKEPIRFLVDTHVHGDHTGGNENFARLGVTIFSRDQLRERLAHPNPRPDGTAVAPAPDAALPVVTYDGPVTIHLNGEDVKLVPVNKAHTDGDTLIVFPKHDVLAVGDYFRSVGYPYVDLANGGSLNGIVAALEQTIALSGPATRIVPGHGPIVGRDAVVAQRDQIMSLRDKVAVLVAQGKSLNEVLSAKLTSPWDAQSPQNAPQADRFVTWVYTEVKAAR